MFELDFIIKVHKYDEQKKVPQIRYQAPKLEDKDLFFWVYSCK